MNKTNRGRDKFTAVAAFVSSCHVVDNELLNGDDDFYVRYFAGKSPVIYVRIYGGNHRNAATEIFNLSTEKHSVTIRIAIPFLVDVTFESGLNLSPFRNDATRRDVAEDIYGPRITICAYQFWLELVNTRRIEGKTIYRIVYLFTT